MTTLESIVEQATIAAVQSYVQSTFGATVSAPALKLMNDIVTLAAKPGIQAALDDIPDVLALVTALDGVLQPPAPPPA